MHTGQQARQLDGFAVFPDGPAAAIHPIAVFQQTKRWVRVDAAHVNGDFAIRNLHGRAGHHAGGADAFLLHRDVLGAVVHHRGGGSGGRGSCQRNQIACQRQVVVARAGNPELLHVQGVVVDAWQRNHFQFLGQARHHFRHEVVQRAVDEGRRDQQHAVAGSLRNMDSGQLFDTDAQVAVVGGVDIERHFQIESHAEQGAVLAPLGLVQIEVQVHVRPAELAGRTVGAGHEQDVGRAGRFDAHADLGAFTEVSTLGVHLDTFLGGVRVDLRTDFHGGHAGFVSRQERLVDHVGGDGGTEVEWFAVWGQVTQGGCGAFHIERAQCAGDGGVGFRGPDFGFQVDCDPIVFAVQEIWQGTDIEFLAIIQCHELKRDGDIFDEFRHNGHYEVINENKEYGLENSENTIQKQVGYGFQKAWDNIKVKLDVAVLQRSVFQGYRQIGILDGQGQISRQYHVVSQIILGVFGISDFQGHHGFEDLKAQYLLRQQQLQAEVVHGDNGINSFVVFNNQININLLEVEVDRRYGHIQENQIQAYRPNFGQHGFEVTIRQFAFQRTRQKIKPALIQSCRYSFEIRFPIRKISST